MSINRKILLGILTIIPILCLIAYIVSIFAVVFSVPHQRASNGPPVMFFVMMGVFAFGLLLNLGVMALYVINAFNNPRIPQDQKVLWLIVIFMGGLVATPIYWYLFIWKDATATTQVQQA